MQSFLPFVLQGSLIQLEPLSQSHKAGLYEASQQENIWTYQTTNGYGEQFDPWFDNLVKKSQLQQQIPYVVRDRSNNKILGTTSYYDIQYEHRRLAIGYTWYIPEVWGTYVNAECKFLLLKFAFEELQMNRVEFNIDARNARSRAAVRKLGAIEEGTLRQHMVLSNGVIRDSVVHSIVKPDWPEIKTKLLTRLNSFKCE